MSLRPETERELAEFVGGFYDDPYGFVMAVFPWGQDKLPDGRTNPLRNKSGPEKWQTQILKDLGEHIRENAERKSMGLDYLVWRSAAASGHGVGKSALVSWVIYFMMSTRKDTRGGITANTANQLETKTWPELAKWHDMAINKHWFLWTATNFYFAQYGEDKRKNYMTTAATVSENNTEAFQGLHNEGNTVFYVFDEASGIFPKLWEVVDGAFTDGEGFFFAFGNPTQADGEFFNCFEKHKEMYHLYKVDSRDISFTNKSAIDDIIRKYGDDSNEAKVRVYGEFPTQSFNGFISIYDVQNAIDREMFFDPGAALIMAVDVARYGDDETVIGWRQGRDFRSRQFRTWKGLNTVRVANAVAEEANREKPDIIVIESTGVGAGVIDILQSRNYRVQQVHTGVPPAKGSKDAGWYVNIRAWLWAQMRDWIIDFGCLPNDEELKQQLCAILYSMDKNEQKVLMESKASMKKRGLPSPDRADTLMLTFATTVARRDVQFARRLTGDAGRMAKDVDYFSFS